MTSTDRGAAGAALTAPESSADAFAESYDVALLDLDGVVYLQGQAIPTAPPALGKAAERGMRFAFVTNNASRTPRRIAQQLTALGVAARETDVVTSAQAAAHLVARRVAPGAPVLVVGAVGLRQAVRAQGLRPVTTASEHPAAVVQGYNRQLSYDQFVEGALAVRDGALFVLSNADSTMPTRRGPFPGNGAFARVIATAAGAEPLVAGKPELPLHREAVERTAARKPLVVGDRLDTDVEGAVRAGTPSLLVLTGVTGPADVVTAPEHTRPTYLARDLGGLLEHHPAVHRDGDGWTCRGWHARSSGGALSLRRPTGVSDSLDGLRALCAAAWNDPRPVDQRALADALHGLKLR